MKQSEFMLHAPNKSGEQVNVHHCKLGPQNDRMYVRRNKDGSVVAYCHHCGLSGYKSNQSQGHKRTRKFDSGTGVGETGFSLPTDLTTDLQEWSPLARAWVRRYGLTDDELSANSVGYSECLDAVVFPCFDEEGNLSMFQYRRILRKSSQEGKQGEDDERASGMPKYVGRRKKGRMGGKDIFVSRNSGIRDGAWDDADSTDGSRVVIVEDALSAIKVSRVPGCRGVAILGASLTEHQATRIAGLAEEYVVFLDNDNRIVQKNQKKAQKMMEPFSKSVVKLVRSNRDPKEHTTAELRELLDDD